VHGGESLLVVAKVDEAVAGHLAGELVLDNLGGKRYYRVTGNKN